MNLLGLQASINPNMALRLLMYVAKIYEKIVSRGGKEKIYSTKLITLPRPEFFVLYNGTTPYPDESTIKLSDAYESISSLGLPEKSIFSLDLTVKVINP